MKAKLESYIEKVDRLRTTKDELDYEEYVKYIDIEEAKK